MQWILQQSQLEVCSYETCSLHPRMLVSGMGNIASGLSHIRVVLVMKSLYWRGITSKTGRTRFLFEVNRKCLMRGNVRSEVLWRHRKPSDTFMGKPSSLKIKFAENSVNSFDNLKSNWNSVFIRATFPNSLHSFQVVLTFSSHCVQSQ